MIFLCSMVSELRHKDICQTRCICKTMLTGVVRPRCVNMGNHQLIGAEMKGCQVRDSTVREISRILCITYVYGGELMSEIVNTTASKT